MATQNTNTYQLSTFHYGLFALLAVGLVVGFYDGLAYMLNAWESPEYSHSYLIPFISLFIVWQQRDVLSRLNFEGSWLGPFILLVSLLAYVVGELSALYVIVQYAFWLTLVGLVLSFSGAKHFKYFLVPLLLIAFTIPLPQFIYNNLSSQLQLLSSVIGVFLIRLFDISVYLEGNVIDLGNYKLQVVEACNGLRYLFPLMVIGFIAAYFFRAEMWKKVVVFLSTIPITIFMNSFRIAIIGVTVQYWGIEMAEGFLHDFEGWVIFMLCFFLLMVEMWLLQKVTGAPVAFGDLLRIEIPARALSDKPAKTRSVPIPFYVSIFFVTLMVLASQVFPNRSEVIPDRAPLTEFPMRLSEWRGNQDVMEAVYIDALKFTDYIMATYRRGSEQVDFYVAYYDSQRKGQSAHSPRSCLPGAGWRIENREVIQVPSEMGEITLNRMVVMNGENGYLMYYWFKQRDRHIANEYLVKWYLFWDSLWKQRTDGALIRLIVPIENDDINAADQALRDFVDASSPYLIDHIPD